VHQYEVEVGELQETIIIAGGVWISGSVQARLRRLVYAEIRRELTHTKCNLTIAVAKGGRHEGKRTREDK